MSEQLELVLGVSRTVVVNIEAAFALAAIADAVTHARRVCGQLGREDFLRRDQERAWKENQPRIEREIKERMVRNGWM